MKIKGAIRNVFAAVAMAAAALVILLPATPSQAMIFITAGYAPPPIPVYAQPPCPGDGYLWTPGYWAWGGGGYFWVPGAWVIPPYAGALWTPGYWGWNAGYYAWFPGRWGLSVGYYGGINYGFGYFGVGFYGGFWAGSHFMYNRAYANFYPGFRGNFYNHPYAGFSGRPGGASFTQQVAFHGGTAFRGSTIGGVSRSGFGGPGAIGGANHFSGGAIGNHFSGGNSFSGTNSSHLGGGNSFSGTNGSHLGGGNSFGGATGSHFGGAAGSGHFGAGSLGHIR